MMWEQITWRPEIGDPSLMGWVTVFAYFGVAFYSLRLAMVHSHHGKDSGFWYSLGWILALLGVNKQLDLQSLITQVGKALAIEQGWYDQRLYAQLAVSILFTLLFLIVFLFLARGIAWQLPDRLLAAGGLCFLGVFIIIRMLSFHKIDRALGLEYSGIRLNWLFELGGISVIALALFWSFRLQK